MVKTVPEFLFESLKSEAKVEVISHVHPLTRMLPGEYKGKWFCNKVKGLNKCMNDL